MSKKTFKKKLEVKDGKIYQENEHIEGYVDAKLPQKSFFGNGSFITVFQTALKEIILEGNLSKGELRLLMYLIATTGEGNSISIDLDIMSSDLKENKGNISRALRGLVERNIVLRQDGYRYGKAPLPMRLSVNYDQFNYDLAYNGRVSNYKKVKFNHPEILDKEGHKLEKYAQRSMLDEIEERENDQDQRD